MVCKDILRTEYIKRSVLKIKKKSRNTRLVCPLATDKKCTIKLYELRPLFFCFSSFKQTLKFINGKVMWKNIHQVLSAKIKLTTMTSSFTTRPTWNIYSTYTLTFLTKSKHCIVYMLCSFKEQKQFTNWARLSSHE